MPETRELSHKIRKTFRNILVVVILIALIFVVDEMYLRMFKHQQIIPRYSESGPHGIRKNISNVQGKMKHYEFNHSISINSHGFRGSREYSLIKPPDTYRIIVLGDSITLGIGVEDNETFSAILEKNLSNERPTEVINMGVSGFGNAEELIQLRKVGFEYNPDLVILTFVPNDPVENFISKLFTANNGNLIRQEKSFTPAIFIRDRLYKIPGYSYLSQHSHLLNYVREKIAFYTKTSLGEKNQFNSPFPDKLSEEQAEFTALLINEIISDVNENNIPLIILNIPIIFNGEMYTNLPVNLLKKTSNTYIVDGQEQIYGNYPLYDISYKIDVHPKPFGHKLIGEWLEAFIEENIW